MEKEFPKRHKQTLFESPIDSSSTFNLPKVIIGTSSLGNLYNALDLEQKKSIVASTIDNAIGIPFFDTAGKYGAGLALESLGYSLQALNVSPKKVFISNKLGWLRTPLTTSEPTFEQGVWKDLEFDAYQDISYDGILKCYEQGNELLDGYNAQFLSVHDPDEYLNASSSQAEKKKRFEDILQAYKALCYLKSTGKAKAIGVGSKDWKIIKRITDEIDLDWVMFANSLTIYSHPKELLEFVEALHLKGIRVINSAVFNGGFLTGSDYFNYQLMDAESDKELYNWRDAFYQTCNRHQVVPAEACVYFALHIPGVEAIAMNSSSAERTGKNIGMGNVKVPTSFWDDMKAQDLIAKNYPHL